MYTLHITELSELYFENEMNKSGVNWEIFMGLGLITSLPKGLFAK